MADEDTVVEEVEAPPVAREVVTDPKAEAQALVKKGVRTKRGMERAMALLDELSK